MRCVSRESEAEGNGFIFHSFRTRLKENTRCEKQNEKRITRGCQDSRQVSYDEEKGDRDREGRRPPRRPFT